MSYTEYMTTKVTKSNKADTKMKTIERKYGKDFGVSSDMNLGNYLKKAGYPSLAKFFKNA